MQLAFVLAGCSGQVLTKVRDAWAGNRTSCAELADGSVWCWGGNLSMQVGDGTSANRAQPVPISSEVAGAATLDVGITDRRATRRTSSSVQLMSDACAW